jgi:peptidoglycan-N-acetylglucosamine deacetylase
VLDVLAARALRATFFVVGARLARPEGRRQAERAAAEGHWLGNHTYSHTVPLGELEDPGAPEREIGRTQALLGDLAHPDRLFRPFGGGGRLGPGLLSPAAVEHLLAGGYTCVLWNAVPRDWEDPEGWVPRALEQCRRAGRALLVLHDLPTGAMTHLERFLDLAGDEGATFPQAPPPGLVPIRRGEAVASLDGLVAA